LLNDNEMQEIFRTRNSAGWKDGIMPKRNRFRKWRTMAGRISPTGNPITDLERAQDVARRYRCEFVDLHGLPAASRALQNYSVDLMFRYDFRAAGRDRGRPSWPSPSPTPAS
jgi:hypothetical protein